MSEVDNVYFQNKEKTLGTNFGITETERLLQLLMAVKITSFQRHVEEIFLLKVLFAYPVSKSQEPR